GGVEGARGGGGRGVGGGAVEPEITWGTDPSQVVGICGRVPDPAEAGEGRRAAFESALQYMGLTPGVPLAGLPVNRVFIGSCTNARLPTLEVAASAVPAPPLPTGLVAFA